ncbi:MAG: thiamine pyrophosphate-requiring protein, partial [Betaproteobacteria bacterium]|nr:thiamine pyrophosphate-requiring protein [Betaproteobacteria bacterium]
MNESRPAIQHSAAHFFLEGLTELGLDYLFCNLGTDHVPLIEEMARWRDTGRAFPRPILCPHESIAVHMAAGYAAMTGRGQGVFVHVDAGTANSAMALHNLFRGRTPALVMAGRAPFTVHGELAGTRDNYVHFLQDPFDQASLVRPYVKWEYTLPSGVVAKEALRRAHSVMHSDPQGPVYMMLPREVLTAQWGEDAIEGFAEKDFGSVRAAGADPELIGALAERLLAARDPVLVTAYAGRNPAAPAALEALARLAGIRVFEYSPTHLNIAHDSPCFAGFQPGEAVSRADLGLLVDVDVPWMPRETRPAPDSFWAQIDVDAIKQDFPMWGFGARLRIQGDSTRILVQLTEALRARASPEFLSSSAKRIEAMAREHAAREARSAKLAAARGRSGAIDVHFLCAELGRVLDPEDVVVNEAIRNTPAVLAQIPRNRPLSLIGRSGG